MTRKILASLLVSMLMGVLLFVVGPLALAKLPADAAPVSKQEITVPAIFEGAYLDWFKSVYNRVPYSGLVQEPLTVFGKDNEVVPAAAESWEVSKDGLVWTFHLRKGLVWSDGVPLTAKDYVFTFRRAASPSNAYDFGWFYSWAGGIKNWNEVVGGKLPPTELGVAAVDDYTLTITTTSPKPYMSAIMVYSYPNPEHIVKKYGDNWATRTDTMVYSGPYRVADWVKNSHIVFVPNRSYRGVRSQILQKIDVRFGVSNSLAAYMNGEIDNATLDPGQLAFVNKNPKLKAELYTQPQYQLNMLAMDQNRPPFNDIRVRKAFTLAIDRSALTEKVLRGLANPAYGVIPKGFPGYDPKLKIEYDPQKARRLLAEAGYPNGKGFPKTELWIRNEAGYMPYWTPAVDFIQAQLKDNLNTDVQVKILDMKTWSDGLSKLTNNFFLAPYNFDFVDPSNFMDLMVSGSRYTFSNINYDQLVAKADSSFNQQERTRLYAQAQRILADEVPAVFLWNNVQNQLWKTNLKSLTGIGFDLPLGGDGEYLGDIYVIK